MKIRHLAAAALAASLATAATANILVVRSTGPSAKNFPPGKSLAVNGKISLKANDTLVVLDGRGTRTLRGPGTFAPGGPAQAASRASALSAVTGGAPQRRARVGAVRSVGGTSLRPNTIWHVDVTKSSNICLADPASLTLWRADASKPVALTVTRASDGASRVIQWDAGQTTVAWPSEMPVTAGGNYRLSWPGGTKPTELMFKTLPARPVGLEAMASSLIQNGCEAQLDLLIETVRLPDETPPAG